MGTFWVYFGYILGTFWIHFGYILGIFCIHFGYIFPGSTPNRSIIIRIFHQILNLL